MTTHTTPRAISQSLTPDLDEARRHLAALDPKAQTFCFQTFDDDPVRDDKSLARTIHGSLDDRAQELIELNNHGAGVFVTVNEVKPGKRRLGKNITRVRALFVDADDPQKLDQVQSGVHRFGVPTSIITETSPFKYHLYWLTSGFPLEQFKEAQQTLVEIFGTDAHPVDLPRVLRLAGFVHRKETPWRSMLHQGEPDRVYAPSVLLRRIQACSATAAPNSNVVALQPRGDTSKPIPGIQPAFSIARSSTTNTAAQSGIVSPHWSDKLLPEQKNEMLRAIAEHPEFIKLADQTKDPWLRLLFGFKDAEGRGAAEAKDIALAWCKTSPRFVSEANFTKDWNSHDRKRKKPTTIGTLLDAAKKAGVDLQPWRDLTNGVITVVGGAPATAPQVSLADFYAYMPMHKYIFVPSRALWPVESVDSRIRRIKLKDANGQPVLDANGKQVTLSASAWLDRFQPVEQMTWAPGLPLVIHDKLILDGGWIDRKGVSCFNLYLPPTITGGDASQAGPWLDHLRYIYPNDAEHILDWLAHRVQRPQEKLNHSLVLGGGAGIGKDTILEPAKYAVGPWNFQEVTPQKILDKYSGYLKSVILRINEARDLGEFDRFQFYERTKIYMAAPPDVLPISEKYIREYVIVNVCGVIITTNHKTDGIHLPADDRRHYIAWSDRKKEDPRFQNNYWINIWDYYEKGGKQHVAAYLRQRDISKFDPKAPPPRTPTFWLIVNSGRSSEDAELADALDQLGNPDAVTLSDVIDHLYGKSAGKGNTRIPGGPISSMSSQDAAKAEFALWLCDRKNRRVIPHRFEGCGYVPVRNPDDKRDGQWKIGGSRQTVYAREDLPVRDQIAAARKLTGGMTPA